MLDQLTDLQCREQLLNEANKALKQRLMEGYQVNALQLGAHGAEGVSYGRPAQVQPPNDAFFHHIECEPTLQIGFQCDPAASVTVAAGPSTNNFMSGWLP